MIRVDVYVYAEVQTDVSIININSFSNRVVADGGTFEAGNCLLSTFESLGGINGIALEARKLDLFDDEKISITSSIQNVNDISKTFTDFSQTFTIPATKNNNAIFKHWYDNSNDNPFSTLVKADAYIEIDTILFRTGKIQLESASLVDQMAANYAITFVGALGNLKDKFAGLFLKDLSSIDYNFNYTGLAVKNKIVTNAVSTDVMFPLISSLRDWSYETGGATDISTGSGAIIFNELFPALKLPAIFKMIEQEFNISFEGTVEEPSTFLTDAKFTNAYLFLKNANEFKALAQPLKINYQTQSNFIEGFEFNLTTDILKFTDFNRDDPIRTASLRIETTIENIPFKVLIYKNQILLTTINLITVVGNVNVSALTDTTIFGSTDAYEFYLSSEQPFTFTSTILLSTQHLENLIPVDNNATITQSISQTTLSTLNVASYFPELKIEDFFSGVLKMFNLTCFSRDGINYTVEQLESFYSNGNDVDISKYTLVDKKALNRVKTFKKINFEFEKSESYTNVAFNSANTIEYGNLNFINTPPTEGEEYQIKLPFENLLFKNLKDKLQVGYNLKVDRQKYIPKATILYDFNSNALTPLVDAHFHFSTNSNGSSATIHTSYKAFGQESLILGDTFSINFPLQQSTLTNEVVNNGLYLNYYSKYFGNIFNFKARLIKVSAILPTSILTSLKLNDNVIIQDTKYLINTMNIDLTTGKVDFELITDIR